MKRTVSALIAGVVIGSGGLALAASTGKVFNIGGASCRDLRDVGGVKGAACQVKGHPYRVEVSKFFALVRDTRTRRIVYIKTPNK